MDAPEKGKPGSSKATEALRKLIQDKEVTIETVARDKYGRSVAKVKADGKSVNRAIQNKLKK